MVFLGMAKREDPNQIPKKFRKLKKSTLKELRSRNSNSFRSFPRNFSFSGKERDENIVLVIRSHWIIYFPQIAMGLFFLLFPSLIFLSISNTEGSITFFIGMTIVAIMISVTLFLYVFLRWYYNVDIITDKRVLDLDFHSVISHSLAEARLDKIVDITHKQMGIVGSLFDIGTIHIQTAGTVAEIDFSKIPRPRDVQDILYELLENKKKGEI
jgi:hypothetical protein